MIKADGVTGRMQSMGQMSMISANRNNRRDAGPLQDSQHRAASINSSIDFKNITQGSIQLGGTNGQPHLNSSKLMSL